MIAIESIRPFRKKDMIAILLFAFLWVIITGFLSSLDVGFQFTLIMLASTAIVAFAVMLIRRAGTATLFSIACAILSFPFNNFGEILGWKKLIVLAASGFVFEIGYLLFHLEISFVPVDVAAGAVLSNLAIPAVLLSFMPEQAGFLTVPVLNFVISQALVGMVGTMITLIAWNILSQSKAVLRFAYEV